MHIFMAKEVFLWAIGQNQSIAGILDPRNMRLKEGISLSILTLKK